MIWHAHIRFSLPDEMSDAERKALIAAERAQAVKLHREKKLLHIWRIAGDDANFSVWQAESLEALQTIHSTLPLYPWLEIFVTQISEHPVSEMFEHN